MTPRLIREEVRIYNSEDFLQRFSNKTAALFHLRVFGIEGHCHAVGREEYNLALGERRTDTVAKYLIALGVSEGRIKTVSYGEEYPIDPAQIESAYIKKRRVHFIVSIEK